jgi:RND superfamily putative drug exporter
LTRIIGFAVRRPRLVAVVWILLVALLATLGRNLDKQLTIHSLTISGTESARAHEIALQEFDSGEDIVLMLRGPGAAVDRQGRKLEKRLLSSPHTSVISPWGKGAGLDALRPRPGVAALVVRVEGGALDVLGPVQSRVDESVTGPVHASVAGFPAVVESIRGASADASKLGELIATPVLLLVLLLVFRSVFAAIMPVVVGGAVVAVGRGVLSLLHGLVQIDLFAAGLMGMMGLALGVDYSLIVVARFREERRGTDIREAVEATVAATARSILPAGCGLILAMAVSALALPGPIAQSASITVITAAVLSMLSAVCVVPALLMLVGPNLDRWSLPRRGGSRVAPLRWSRRLSRQPRAVVSIMLAMLILAGFAFTLNTNVASVAFLPAGTSGRQQQEEVQRALGPGWIAPMEVIMSGRGSPVTSARRLRALADFQRRVERDPRIDAVAGFAQIERGTRRLNGIEGQLADQEHGLSRLQTGISRVRKGAELNTNGLRRAAQGSGALDSGIGLAGTGAGALAGALAKTSAGSGRLTQSLGRAGEGSGQLSEGAGKASAGAGKLAEGLAKAEEQTGEVVGTARLFTNAMRSGEDRLDELQAPLGSTEAQLATAWGALRRMTAGRADPEYAAALRAVEEASRNLTGTDPETGEQPNSSYGGVDAGLERANGQFGVGLYLAARLDKSGHQAKTGMRKLAKASARLDRGLQRLALGSRRVADGVAALAQGSERLSPALVKLNEGAERLSGGLGQLESGAGQLAGGLGVGAEKSTLLSGALGRIGSGLKQSQGPDSGASGLDQLRQRSPGFFHSPYFTLASLDGSRSDQRSQLASLINLDHGGSDARMLVIPRDPPTTAEAQATKDRLEEDADDLARQTGTEVVVGGVAPSEIDVNEEFRDQAPLLRVLLSLVSLIILIPVTRSLAIPILAAAINLITVSASFGLLALLFNGSLLGGPGYVDAVVIPSAMIVMFGLAIDYEVFVFARIREEYLRSGSTSEAIEKGLDHTGHVVTGAATIMIAVFLAFSISEFITIRNFGIAQAIGVFIDAFIVRLVVIPAAMGRLGKWCWWIPGWLDRLLPGKPMPTTKAAGRGAP